MDVDVILSWIDRTIAACGMNASDVAHRVDFVEADGKHSCQAVDYSRIDAQKLHTFIARIAVKGCVARAAQHGCIDVHDLQRRVREAYEKLVKQFQVEHSWYKAQPASFQAVRTAVYDANNDTYTYVVCLDYVM